MLKSYKFWTGLAGSVGLFLTAISDSLGIKIDTNGVKEIIMTFCGVLIAIGIVQKPIEQTDKDQTSQIGEIEQTNKTGETEDINQTAIEKSEEPNQVQAQKEK